MKLLVIGILGLFLAGFVVYWFGPENSSEASFSLDFDQNFSGDVIVVGAGSAGLTAAHTLKAAGVNVTVIEAQDVYGGRMREAQDFADFPIDLGAEWIHTDPSILNDIAGISGNVDALQVETITYSPRDVYEWEDGELNKVSSILTRLYSEYKFKNTTWFNFFEENIVPPIRDDIVLSEPVSNIEYAGDKVVVSTVGNQNFEPKNTYTADRVIVTVPIAILQNEYIGFEPALPQDKVAAINSITVPEGLKVFVEFKEKFYPDILTFNEFSDETTGEEKIYYDAAFGKDVSTNVLGLFTIGRGADEFVDLEDDEIIAKILTELDEVYDGAASQNYVKHITQNWSSNRFIAGSYATEFAQEQQVTVDTIAAPLDNKIFFAGSSLSVENQSTVHGAAESGFNAAKQVVELP